MDTEPTSCTTILVGKNATYDGSTMMARTEDAPAGRFNPKKHIVVKPENQPKHYKSVLSKFEIDLPDNPMQYTCMPNAIPDEGVWGEAGINIKNVAVSETETISSNARVLGADPLVDEGISEEDILTITLPYINSAREGVLRLGSILKQYGTYEMNGIGFQDENEVWWLETIGGHHWIAKRVPDDGYVVGPNQQGIKEFDFVDAFGEKKNHLCSEDMIEFIVNNKLDLTFKAPEDLKKVTNFDVRAALGSHSDFDRLYNTPRAWFMHKYLCPKKYKWEGCNRDFSPEDDNLPWSLTPDHKITVEDVKYLMSSYYQGTKFNPYGKHGQYSRVDDSPKYIKEVDKDVTTESYYWCNRMIAALADPHYSEAMVWIDRYQNLMAAKGHEFVNKFDKKFKEGNAPKNFLQDANEEIAQYWKKETTNVLGKVLHTASLKMKNAYSRSDA